MKRRFTILTAALALLVSLAIPMGMRGQTRSVTYEPATSISAGDVVLLVAEGTNYKKELSGFSTTSTIYGTVADYTTAPAGVYPLTVVAGNSSGSFAFKNSENKYLSWSSGNSLQLSETLNNNSSWTYNYAYTVTTISNVATTDRQIKYNSSSPRFACYTSGQQTVKLYKQVNTSLEDCDLALAGAPVALSFDLYNNTSAQTISYTTSSTGEVTVADSDYITTVVDQTNKTITVTPVAVTNGAKVITVNQAADDNYAAGSKTFTINITDSTPFTGGDVTFNATIDKGTSPLVKQGVTFSCTSGVLNNGSEYRLYKNSVTTFSVSEGTITQIAFTGVSGYPASGFATQTGWTTDGNNGTWTGNAQEVSFTASDAQVRATLIVVTVEMSTEPSFVITNNEVLAYDATSGSFNYTIINPVQGGYLTVAENVSWISDPMAEDGLVTFNTEINSAATSREGIISMRYTYHGELMTYDVTITQAGAPVIYSSIPALFEAATDTETSVLVTFNNWVVSGVSTNGKNVFVTDNNGNGFVIYGTDMNNDYAVGDILSGTAVSCTLKKYNGFAELINLDANDLTITAGGTVTTANVAMADLAGINTGALLQYEGLTCEIDGNKTNLTDGTTTIQVYNALYAFEALEDGKTYNITGIYQQYYNTKEILPRSVDDIEEVQVQHNEYTLTVSNLVHVTTYVFDASNQSEALLVGAGQVDIYDGTEVMISLDVEEGYVIESLIVDGVDVTSQIDADAYTFTMPTNAVTVTATAVEYVAPTPGDKYVKVTSTADLTSGQYLIVYEEGSVAFDGSLETLDAASNTIEVILNNDEIDVTSETAASEFTIDMTAGTIMSASENYIGRTGDSNGMNTSTTEAYTNSISIDNSGNAVVVASGGAYLRYNATSGQDRFRYFKSSSYSGQKAIQLYKKVENTPAEYTLTIEGYGNSDGGYYLIASPVTVNLTNHDHDMTTGDFDLYYFDQAEADEWRNYKQNTFNLEPGKGYLYAHKTGGNFTLTGTAYEGDGEIELVYDDAAIDFKGWNLVGNPWGVKAYPDHAFYTMAEGGASIDVTPNVAGTEVAAMTGIFVVAEGENENETVTFSKTATGKSANLALNITNSSKLVDRAIVRFGEGRQLPKFQLRDNSTKIYFEQSNKDYAIVNAEEMGEMPVSFKAEKNGTYTFSVNTENVEMEYLHLIDNMTGADIDLIANPSYSFEAKVTDYASRFRLVFSANSSINEQNANNFAFFNGNDWTINNEGEATLQVVDMTGRVLSTETVNGNATTKVNAATGVYMLRLINGNNIKTQKVVVK